MSVMRPLILAAAIALPGLALAQTPSALPKAKAGMGGACKADVAAFCAGVEPGEGRIAQCFKANADKLSTPCREALAERKAKRQSPGGTLPAAPAGG